MLTKLAGTRGPRTTYILPAAAEMSRSITSALGAPVGFKYIALIGSAESFITCMLKALAST